jgi:hypothetical protein
MIQALQSQRVDLNSQLSRLKANLTSVESSLAASEARVEDLTELESARMSDISRLQSEATELNSELAELNASCAGSDDQRIQMIQALQLQRVDLNSQLSWLQANLTLVESSLAASEAWGFDCSALYTVSESKRSQFESELFNVRLQLLNLQQDHATMVDNLQAELRDLNVSCSNSVKCSEDLQDQLDIAARLNDQLAASHEREIELAKLNESCSGHDQSHKVSGQVVSSMADSAMFGWIAAATIFLLALIACVCQAQAGSRRNLDGGSKIKEAPSRSD